MLQNVLWNCGSLRISFSRWTPEKVSRILMQEFSTNPKVYIWNGKGPNPHMGHLAGADAFVITADSVSMLSKACSTGKPVYVVGAERCTWNFAEFQKSLRERGVVRPFTGKEDISESWSYPPLNDTVEAATRVVEALAEHGWTIQYWFSKRSEILTATLWHCFIQLLPIDEGSYLLNRCVQLLVLFKSVLSIPLYQN